MSLRTGTTTSCGCVPKELARKNITVFATPKTRKHGETGTLLYQLWARMRTRCNNVSGRYKYWGEKGITVCPEWEDYLVFKAWALENGWAPGLQIDRVRSSEGYGPNNCQFLAPSEHSRKTMKERYGHD